jgi:hypothetical protein
METKTGHASPRRTNWAIFLMILALLATIVLSACNGDNATPTIVASTATPAAWSMSDIAEDVGIVSQVFEGDPGRNIIVFEENHGSPAGQIEIAIMLNRLYERYGLRHIGLEGRFAVDGPLDVSWFHEPLSRTLGVVRQRGDVIVQLLEEGEITSSEMMALVYDDVTVAGIENAEEYSYELPTNAVNATTIYLYKIAIVGMTEDEMSNVSNLLDEDKVWEAIELGISTDPWASDKYERLIDVNAIMSAEELLKLADEIKDKARQVGADITPEDEADLRDLRRFYELASQRTDTMVKNTLELFKQSPEAPVALITGAAHTERAVELLKQSGVSFAVISGNSLVDHSRNGDLSNDAFDRKSLALSVDITNTLGSLLNDRRKPPPVVEQPWLQRKAASYLLADAIAVAVASGEEPPFNDTLSTILPELEKEGISPNMDSFEIVGDDVIFSFNVSGASGGPIWVRAHANPNLVIDTLNKNFLLETRLLQGLSNVKAKPEPDNTKQAAPSEELKPISSAVVAKFGVSRAEVLRDK